MSNVKQRLLMFLEAEKIRTSYFEKRIGVSNGYVKNISKSMQPEVLEKISREYPQLSIEWLMVGKGEMMKLDTPHDMKRIDTPKYTERIFETVDLPLFDMSAAANLKSLQTGDDRNIIGEIRLSNVPGCDGACYVRGDSMQPLIKNGDVVAFKTLQPLPENITFGKTYIIALSRNGDDYLVIKNIERSEKGHDWVKLVSINPAHSPQDIEFSDIRGIGVIKFSFTMKTIDS